MLLVQNKTDFIEFDLFGDVGESWWDEETITVDKVKNILNENKNKSLLFNISTLGGDVNEALIIHDIIKMHDAPTKSRIIGATASAGTVISSATDEAEMSENALFLAHNVWTFTVGNAQQLRKDADNLEKFDDRLLGIYHKNAERRGVEKKRSEILGLMEEEKWIDAEEALAWGFIDEVKIFDKAPAQISEDKLNNSLPSIPKIYLNKYNDMSLFPKKNKADDGNSVVNSVQTKDGERTFVYENELAEGSELKVLGSSDPINGEFELGNEHKIKVENNKVTSMEKVEASADPEPQNNDNLKAEIVAETLASVQEILTPVIEAQKEINGKLDKLKGSKSTAKPAKGAGPQNQVKNFTTKKAETKSQHDKFVEENKV